MGEKIYFVEITRCNPPKQVIVDMDIYLRLKAEELAETVVRFYYRNEKGERVYVTELEELAMWFGSKPKVIH